MLSLVSSWVPTGQYSPAGASKAAGDSLFKGQTAQAQMHMQFGVQEVDGTTCHASMISKAWLFTGWLSRQHWPSGAA
jgi:hypothetical protein